MVEEELTNQDIMKELFTIGDISNSIKEETLHWAVALSRYKGETPITSDKLFEWADKADEISRKESDVKKKLDEVL